MPFAWLHTVTPWSQDLFIHKPSRLPGEHTASPAAIFSAQNYSNTIFHCSARYPLTPGSRECTCEQSALPRSTTSVHIQCSWGSNPWFLTCTSRTLPLSPDAPQKVKVEVYSLVSSVKRYSPHFTQLPPGHRTCSFISHLNSPGSIQPGCHFQCIWNYSNTQTFSPTEYLLTPGSKECTR